MEHYDHAGVHVLLHRTVDTRPRLLSLPEDYPERLPSLGCCMIVFTQALCMRRKKPQCLRKLLLPRSDSTMPTKSGGPSFRIVVRWEASGKSHAQHSTTCKHLCYDLYLCPHDTAISLFCS
jgi:hypothetical protein